MDTTHTASVFDFPTWSQRLRGLHHATASLLARRPETTGHDRGRKQRATGRSEKHLTCSPVMEARRGDSDFAFDSWAAAPARSAFASSPTQGASSPRRAASPPDTGPL